MTAAWTHNGAAALVTRTLLTSDARPPVATISFHLASVETAGSGELFAEVNEYQGTSDDD